MTDIFSEHISNEQQMERLVHLEFRAFFLGKVGRKDIVARFGVKEAAATRDFTLYNKIAPDNLRYDLSQRLYKPSKEFKPYFELSTRKCLATLTEGFGDCINLENGFSMCETTRIGMPKLENLAFMTRAIHTKVVIKIEYFSATGVSEREIIPFALIDNGSRWHIRAYDRKRARFSDFVMNRIKSIEFLPHQEIAAYETAAYDLDWQNTIELVLKPHQNIEYPQSIEMDFNMVNGRLRHRARYALVAYFLRAWNVDCSGDESLEGFFQLALENAAEVKALNLENHFLAAGL